MEATLPFAAAPVIPGLHAQPGSEDALHSF